MRKSNGSGKVKTRCRSGPTTTRKETLDMARRRKGKPNPWAEKARQRREERNRQFIKTYIAEDGTVGAIYNGYENRVYLMVAGECWELLSAERKREIERQRYAQVVSRHTEAAVLAAV
jgi:hypothetical protein